MRARSVIASGYRGTNAPLAASCIVLAIDLAEEYLGIILECNLFHLNLLGEVAGRSDLERLHSHDEGRVLEGASERDLTSTGSRRDGTRAVSECRACQLLQKHSKAG